MALGVEVPGGKIKNKNFEFEAFIGPSGQNQLYHTPLLFKILDLTENKKIVNDPFKIKVERLVVPSRDICLLTIKVLDMYFFRFGAMMGVMMGAISLSRAELLWFAGFQSFK